MGLPESTYRNLGGDDVFKFPGAEKPTTAGDRVENWRSSLLFHCVKFVILAMSEDDTTTVFFHCRSLNVPVIFSVQPF